MGHLLRNDKIHVGRAENQVALRCLQNPLVAGGGCGCRATDHTSSVNIVVNVKNARNYR